MASSEIKTLILGGNTYALNDTVARVLIAALETVVNGKASASELDALETVVAGKQATLVSGTNIKTVNGNSLLGSGNITINSGGSSVTVDTALSTSSTNPVQNKVVTNAIYRKQDALESGTNIKTINGESLLGSGNIEISSSSGGEGLTDHDFTILDAGTASSSRVVISFAANSRGYAVLNTAIDISLDITNLNAADNYVLVYNSSSSDIDVAIGGINSLASSSIHTPTDGITVPAGKYVEIGIYANSNIAVITASSSLT